MPGPVRFCRRRSDLRKMNEPIGRCGSFKSRASANDRLGDGIHCFVLADHALVQFVGEVQQLFLLAFEQLGHGHAGPAADDGGDVFLADFLLQQPRRAIARVSGGVLLGFELFVPIPAACRISTRPLGSNRNCAPPARSVLSPARSARGPRGPFATAFFSFCQRALSASAVAFWSASSFSNLCKRSRDALSDSFLSASRSISSCITRRFTSSSSVGSESISVRNFAAASSTRSIALSGKKAIGDVAIGKHGRRRPRPNP